MQNEVGSIRDPAISYVHGLRYRPAWTSAPGEQSRRAALAPAGLSTHSRDIRKRIGTRTDGQCVGGAWIACNDMGLAVALLNVNPTEADSRVPPHSRGNIVPSLICCRTLDEVREAPRTRHAPLCAVPARGDSGRQLRSPALVPAARTSRRTSLVLPQMFASSGLGDARVEGPRRELFEQTVVGDGDGDLRARQGRFHAHRWMERPEVSVWMSRSNAWTVSRTVIEIDERLIVMRYAAEPDWIDRPARLARASAS